MSWKAWFRSSRLGSVLESVRNWMKESLCAVILQKNPYLYRKLMTNFLFFPWDQFVLLSHAVFGETLQGPSIQSIHVIENYKNNSTIIFNVCTTTMPDKTYHGKVFRLLEFLIWCHLCVCHSKYSYFLRHFVLLANNFFFRFSLN